MPTLAAPVVVRDVTDDDAAELADVLNSIIAQGGTTALETPFTADALADAYLLGPKVLSCVVAVNPHDGRLEGFQTLGRLAELPADVGDIGTFTRRDSIQRGVGSALFAATVTRARALGLAALSATIRADNAGGLAFYRKQGFVDHSVTRDAPLNSGLRVDRIVKRFVL